MAPGSAHGEQDHPDEKRQALSQELTCGSCGKAVRQEKCDEGENKECVGPVYEDVRGDTIAGYEQRVNKVCPSC